MPPKKFVPGPGDWICPRKKCRNVNFFRRTSCNVCGKERTPAATVIKAGGVNIGKTPGKEGSAVFSAHWKCRRCNHVNFAKRLRCFACNKEKEKDGKMMKAGGTEIWKTAAEESGGFSTANDWWCKTCNNVNFARRLRCFVCNKEKETEDKMMKAGATEIWKTATEASGGFSTANDWWCNTCNNVNFARRLRCFVCNKEKETEGKMMKAGGTEIWKTAAEESGGFSTDNDWWCKTCGNVNWARRSECNRCKSAKPEEGTTGNGGGFNERENVENIVCTESDDECDEFGRTKGKDRENIQPSNLNGDEEGDQDDDEDADLSNKLDDDDGDLSKYDLVTEEDDEDS